MAGIALGAGSAGILSGNCSGNCSSVGKTSCALYTPASLNLITLANTSGRDRCALSTHLWPSPNDSPSQDAEATGDEAERLRAEHSPGSPLAARLNNRHA